MNFILGYFIIGTFAALYGEYCCKKCSGRWDAYHFFIGYFLWPAVGMMTLLSLLGYYDLDEES